MIFRVTIRVIASTFSQNWEQCDHQVRRQVASQLDRQTVVKYDKFILFFKLYVILFFLYVGNIVTEVASCIF